MTSTLSELAPGRPGCVSAVSLAARGHHVVGVDANRANRANLEERLPRISQPLTDDVESLSEHGEMFIAGTKDPVVVAAIDSVGEERIVIDLVRLPCEAEQLKPRYVGIGW